MLLSSIKKQFQQSGALTSFFNWWLGEIKSLIPNQLKKQFVVKKNHLILDMRNDICRLISLRNGNNHLLAVFDIHNDSDSKLQEVKQQFLSGHNISPKVTVILPAEKLLSRNCLLPLATENSLRSVLKFEIDRLTPFRANQAFFGYNLIQRHPDEEKLMVLLVAARRDYLENIRNRLQALELEAAAIIPGEQIPDSGETLYANTVKQIAGSTLNLLPPEERPQEEPIWSKINRNLAVAALAMLIVIFLIPNYRINQMLAHLEEDIAAIEKQAQQTSEKQFLLMQQAELGTSLIHRKNHEATRINIIRDLTQLISDETWIYRLDIDGLKVNLHGESDNSSKLIELLEQFPSFQNVSFESPVTRNTATGKERFEIQLDLAQERVK